MTRSTVALLTIATALTAAPRIDAQAAGMDALRLAQIPRRMQSFVDAGAIPGAVTLVQRKGVIAALDAVGYQDLETKAPMKTDTIFQIMSMTKPVTATGIMILMEQGLLTLNDLVERHLPEFRNLWVLEKEQNDHRELVKPTRPITIRDLLTHTAGIYRWLPDWTDNFASVLRKPLSEVVLLASQQPLEFQPGTRWQYSASGGFAILGRIIEVVSGQPYEQFITERILQPLSMKDSFFFPPVDKRSRIASVYALQNARLVNQNSLTGSLYREGMRNPFPEGGLYSTAEDLARFYQMFLNGGVLDGRRILSRATVALMTANHTPGLNNSWGLGWSVVQGKSGSLTLRSEGSFGHGGAFGTQGWIDPQRQLIGVFLVQRGGATEASSVFEQMAEAAVIE